MAALILILSRSRGSISLFAQWWARCCMPSQMVGESLHRIPETREVCSSERNSARKCANCFPSPDALLLYSAALILLGINFSKFCGNTVVLLACWQHCSVALTILRNTFSNKPQKTTWKQNINVIVIKWTKLYWSWLSRTLWRYLMCSFLLTMKKMVKIFLLLGRICILPIVLMSYGEELRKELESCMFPELLESSDLLNRIEDICRRA